MKQLRSTLFTALMVVIALILLIFEFGCQTRSSPPANSTTKEAATSRPQPKPCPSETEDIALFDLHMETFGTENVGTESERKAEQACIDGLRKWAQGLKDSCAQESYYHWLDYYERGVQDANRAAGAPEFKATGKTQLESKLDHEMEFDRQYKSDHNIPKPPPCPIHEDCEEEK